MPKKYTRLEGVDLVGVVDTDAARAEEVAQECQTSARTDYRALFGNVDCVSIAVPTQLHATVARDFLVQGIDVLVEKTPHGNRHRRPPVSLTSRLSTDAYSKSDIWSALTPPSGR